MEDKLNKRLEELNLEKEELVKHLTKLNEDYKIGVRNLDRIDGAIFIINESLGKLPIIEESKDQIKPEEESTLK